MTRPASPGILFRQALSEEQPLQIIGAINANHALLAKRAGYRAIYLSGGGVAAGSLGLRSEEHTSAPVTNAHLVCRLLLEKKNTNNTQSVYNEYDIIEPRENQLDHSKID